MAEYEVTRKLTTILAADVVGYTRLPSETSRGSETLRVREQPKFSNPPNFLTEPGQGFG